MNTTEFLALSSAIVPQREAVIFEEKRFSYEDLLERVNRLADALANRGIGRGDRIAAIQVNCNEHIEAYFAAAKLDAIYVPINFRVKNDELSFMLKDSEPKALLAGGRYYDLVEAGTKGVASLNTLIALDGPHDSWLSYEKLLASGKNEERFPQGDDDDTTIIMFTAGTTGTPKGVMLTYNSFASYIISNISPADPEVEERNILTVPLHHIAGMQAVLSAIYGGRTLIIQRQFQPVEWMQLVQREKVNRAMMVPTMLKQLIDHPDFLKYDLSSLQVITYGAAPMPLPVIQDAIRKLPKTRFINAFGQTETASTITMLPPEDHDLSGSPQVVQRKLKRLSSIGKPLEDVEVRIVDEQGIDVPKGEVGEIIASGPRLMKGYWHREDATRETMRNGWLFTGDLGYMDEDGYIFLAGRAKDFIKRGGEMISPDEVEQVLMSHPAVDEAAIIGVPDDYWGERIRAVVVVRPGSRVTGQELIEHCHERLASYKRPESVVFVPELPRNPMGKVLKRVLREEFDQPIVEGGDASSVGKGQPRARAN
ncbi:MAG: long-chain-fatty-acid--CoA ligase [Chloroflexi bacterium]|nr:long-chain-fatty-acid--CoA ligase [Chloroflexota bacterium]